METVTGRIIADAKVNTLPDERQVVNFTVALNAYVKSKNATEAKQYTTYVNCAYWISTKVAAHLTKGAVVEITGRLYVNAYKGLDGEARASLHCHVSHITIHHSIKKESTAVTANTETDTIAEDLPF